MLKQFICRKNLLTELFQDTIPFVCRMTNVMQAVNYLVLLEFALPLPNEMKGLRIAGGMWAWFLLK